MEKETTTGKVVETELLLEIEAKKKGQKLRHAKEENNIYLFKHST